MLDWYWYWLFQSSWYLLTFFIEYSKNIFISPFLKFLFEIANVINKVHRNRQFPRNRCSTFRQMACSFLRFLASFLATRQPVPEEVAFMPVSRVNLCRQGLVGESRSRRGVGSLRVGEILTFFLFMGIFWNNWRIFLSHFGLSHFTRVFFLFFENMEGFGGKKFFVDSWDFFRRVVWKRI